MAIKVTDLRVGMKVSFARDAESPQEVAVVSGKPAFGKVQITTADGGVQQVKVGELSLVPPTSVYEAVVAAVPVQGHVPRDQQLSADPLAETRAVAAAMLEAEAHTTPEALEAFPEPNLKTVPRTQVRPEIQAPDALIDAQVRSIQAKEFAAQEQARKEITLARKLGRKPQRYAVLETTETDVSRIDDVPEGYVAGHFRAHDADGKPDGSRIQQMQRWGWKIHTDSEGNPRVDEWGVQMICSYADEAKRRAYHMRGLVSEAGREALEDQFQHALDQLNREAGRTAVIPVVGADYDNSIGDALLNSANLAALAGQS